MKSCANCRHWKHEREDFRQLVKFPFEPSISDEEYDRREKAADEADLLYGECTAVHFGRANLGQPLPLVLAVDGSDYYAAVFTRAEFGCVLWDSALPRPGHGDPGTDTKGPRG